MNAGSPEQTDDAGEYPAMPWRLRSTGVLLASVHWVEAHRARKLVPPEFSIIQFLPGRTLGGLFLASYGRGSDLEYNELIVSAAMLWNRGRPALWVTDLFVDSRLSLSGGKSLLGAPKQLAPFSRAEGVVTVGASAAPICRIDYRIRLWLWRQRVRMATLHRDVRDSSGGTAAWHGQEVRGRWGLARIRTEIPPASPIRQLGLGAPLLGICGRDVELLLGGAPFLPLELVPVTPDPAR